MSPNIKEVLVLTQTMNFLLTKPYSGRPISSTSCGERQTRPPAAYFVSSLLNNRQTHECLRKSCQDGRRSHCSFRTQVTRGFKKNPHQHVKRSNTNQTLEPEPVPAASHPVGPKRPMWSRGWDGGAEPGSTQHSDTSLRQMLSSGEGWTACVVMWAGGKHSAWHALCLCADVYVCVLMSVIYKAADSGGCPVNSSGVVLKSSQ